MKFIILLAILTLSGYYAYQQMHPHANSLPSLPPPLSLAEQQPAALISEAEQEKILHAANDPDSNVRWEALVLLDKIRTPNAYPFIFEKLHKDIDPDLRAKIATMLGERQGSDVVQNLVWAAQDREPDVRIAALKALDRLGDYSAASAITDSVRDPDETVRLQALKTLSSLQDKKQAALDAERRKQEELRKQSAAGANQEK